MACTASSLSAALCKWRKAVISSRSPPTCWEPANQLAGQRADGELLPHAENRIGPSQHLRHSRQGQVPSFLVCRRLLHLPARPFGPGLPHARPSRTARGKHNVTRTRNAERIISLSRCLDCQRRTGSVFGIAVFFAKEQVMITEELSTKFS